MTLKSNKALKIIKKTTNNYHYLYKLIGSGEKSESNMYSIFVELIMPDGKRTCASCENEFLNIEDALDFFNKLVSNLVTPINLLYVIEDELKN